MVVTPKRLYNTPNKKHAVAGVLSLSDCVFYIRNIPLFIQRFSGGGKANVAVSLANYGMAARVRMS